MPGGQFSSVHSSFTGHNSGPPLLEVVEVPPNYSVIMSQP
jgi:hypothetical protein